MEIGFFDANKTGEITSRLTSDTAEMANDLTWVFRFSLEALVRIGGTISYMLVRSWRLGLLAIAIVPITAIVNRYYARFLRQNQKSVQTALAGANVVATECVSSIRLVCIFWIFFRIHTYTTTTTTGTLLQHGKSRTGKIFESYFDTFFFDDETDLLHKWILYGL